MSERKSIPTVYDGRRFRSKLEADWARTFDHLGIAWEYEKEGLYLGDTFYLPDFYLTKSRQYVEVKGSETPEDVRKWMALVQRAPQRPFTDTETCPDVVLVVARPDGVFHGFTRGSLALRDRSPIPENFPAFLLDHATEVELGQCVICGGWWFFVSAGSWRCQCCGYGDGNTSLLDRIISPMAEWPLTGAA